jgi:hypothetical protein
MLLHIGVVMMTLRICSIIIIVVIIVLDVANVIGFVVGFFPFLIEINV